MTHVQIKAEKSFFRKTGSYCIALGIALNILWQTIIEKNMKNAYITESLSCIAEISTTLWIH